MAPVNCLDAKRASVSASSQHENGADEFFALNDFEEELRLLSAANQQLLHDFQHQEDDQVASAEAPCADTDESALLRLENAELRARIDELEAAGAGQGEELWLERQREYEMLLEEKSEVIRGLHQKFQEEQESAIGGGLPANSPMNSGTGLGQAEEIFRLKREMDDQRRQLEQDEQDMISQMRQMELTMAKERAELARQRQEVQRLHAELAREIENSSRDPELRERLHSLRRTQEPRPQSAATHDLKPVQPAGQNSSGFFRRIFG